MFGIVQRIGGARSWPLPEAYSPSAIAMEEAVDRLGERVGDARGRLEVGEPGVRHGLGRTEVREQRPLARRSENKINKKQK